MHMLTDAPKELLHCCTAWHCNRGSVGTLFCCFCCATLARAIAFSTCRTAAACGSSLRLLRGGPSTFGPGEDSSGADGGADTNRGGASPRAAASAIRCERCTWRSSCLRSYAHACAVALCCASAPRSRDSSCRAARSSASTARVRSLLACSAPRIWLAAVVVAASCADSSALRSARRSTSDRSSTTSPSERWASSVASWR
mmetsp:Transcript_22304/g.71356  ORF Transcript_22304/g.71356 Transcript_22304/m.71356 type:complete len:200 (-) Transcript_22304:454-1053(-)